jgi:hypothetical protein
MITHKAVIEVPDGMEGAGLNRLAAWDQARGIASARPQNRADIAKNESAKQPPKTPDFPMIF